MVPHKTNKIIMYTFICMDYGAPKNQQNYIGPPKVLIPAPPAANIIP